MEAKKGPNTGFILITAGVLFVLWFWYSANSGNPKAKEISFGEFMESVQKGEVASPVTIKGTEVSGRLKDGVNFVTYKERARQIGPELEKYKVGYKIISESEGSFWSALLINFLPMILMIVIFIFIFRGINNGLSKAADRQTQFGKMNIREPTKEDVKTFADVAGIDEALEDAREIVNFFRDRKRINLLGGRVPKGVLLMGEPGTGKTLLARAIAGEADVPFLAISGSDFVQMFVGVGASRVRDLFEQAAKLSPCIIFIDELDAMGRQRGAGVGGGNDEREQTLNEILVQMDGFGHNSGIMVIAATNRPDVLDAALTRAGRFDRKIMIPRPDVGGREAILKIHARGKKFAALVDFGIIARETKGMTGADLENIVNEAALVAVRRGKPAIETDDIDSAIETVIVGKKRSLKTIREELEVVAVHEAGHAIVYWARGEFEELRKVSIAPHGGALGLTWHLPVEDRHLLSKRQAEDSILGLLGGRAAEELVLGRENITSGASNDLDRATDLIHKMVAEYGMDDEFGLASFGSGANPFLGREMALHSGMSQGMQQRIEERVQMLMSEHYARARNMLNGKMEELRKLSSALLERETLSADEVNDLLKK